MLTANALNLQDINLSEKTTEQNHYISLQEDLLLASWVSDLRCKKTNWGLARGKFYYEAFEILGDDRISQTFGSFRQLAIHLHEQHKIASPSRAYELRRAYTVYLRILELGIEIPARSPFSTEVLLELEKVKDEHFQEAAQWCKDTWEQTGELRAIDFLKELQEEYPAIDWLRRKPKEQVGTGTTKKPKKDLVELEQAVQNQREQIEEQKARINALSSNHQQLEEQLLVTAKERDEFKRKAQELEEKVRELEGLLQLQIPEPQISTPEDEPELPVDSCVEVESETMGIIANPSFPSLPIFQSSLLQALDQKRREGTQAIVECEFGDWSVYDQDGEMLGGTEEGDEAGLERVINAIVPRVISNLLTPEMTCTANPETGCYTLQVPGEEEEVYLSAASVAAQILRFTSNLNIGAGKFRR
jgi:hypothetical protein